jgi:hypothetical protein
MAKNVRTAATKIRVCGVSHVATILKQGHNMNTLSIPLPNNLEQQLLNYCQQHQRSKTEIIYLALERLFATSNKPLTPYELGKEGFGADDIHEGDIAQNTKSLLKARFAPNADS